MPADVAARVAALGQFLATKTGHFVNVGARREGAVAGSGQDHGLDRLIGLVFGPLLVDLAHQRAGERVQFFRPVQRDQPAAVEALSQNEIVSHLALLPSRSRQAQYRNRTGWLVTPGRVWHSGEAQWADALRACGSWNWRGIRPGRAAA